MKTAIIFATIFILSLSRTNAKCNNCKSCEASLDIDFLNYKTWKIMVANKLTNMGIHSCAEEKLSDLKNISQEVILNLENLDSKKNTVCELFENKMEETMRPLSQFVDECRKAKQLNPLSDHVVRAAKSVVAYICNNKGEDLLEFFNPCYYDNLNEDSSKKLQELSDKLDKASNGVYDNPADVGKECGMLKEMRKIIDIAASNCSEKLRRLHIGIFDSLLSVCPTE